jgi:hypothetical protein
MFSLMPLLAFGQRTDPGCLDGSNVYCECVELLANDTQVWLDNDAAAQLVEQGVALYCTLGVELVEQQVTDEAPPVNYRLSDAFPNPFNPTTSVELTIAQAQNVRVSVFNTLGQQVESVDYGYADAGKYTMRLELSAQPSGVYVIQVVGDTFVASRTVTMLK